MGSALRSLSHPEFRRYFAGQFTSMVGTWMQQTAQSWLVYRLTGSGAMLGLVTAAGQAPSVVLGLLGGAAADRWDRRTVLLWTQAAAMLIAAALAFLTAAGLVQVWHVMALSVLGGIVRVFDMPARQALVPTLVPREDMGNAIALSGILLNVSRMIGPAAGGFVILKLGEAGCFWIDAASYLAMIAALWSIRSRGRPEREAGVGELERIRQGLRYAASDPERRSILLLLSAVSLAGVPAIMLMPIYSEGVLRSGPGGLGMLTSAFAVGALAASFTLARRSAAGDPGHDVGRAAALFGAALASLGLLRSFPAACVVLVAAGYGMMTTFSGGNIRLQDRSSDEMRGRVMGLFSMTFMAVTPFGTLATGWAGDHLGPPRALAAGGLLTAAAGAAYAFGRRR